MRKCFETGPAAPGHTSRAEAASPLPAKRSPARVAAGLAGALPVSARSTPENPGNLAAKTCGLGYVMSVITNDSSPHSKGCRWGRVLPRTVASWLGVLGCVISLAAAVPASSAPPPPEYQVVRWTTDQGLSQNRISCLKETRDGYLWLGTWFGLVRFDGMRFTVFDQFNTPELVNDTINALAEDSEGTLWMGTMGGLVSYRDHQFQRLTKADGLLDQDIDCLRPCRAGGIWLLAGKSSVMRLAGGKFSQVAKVPASSEDEFITIQESTAGSLLIGQRWKWVTLTPGASEPQTLFAVDSREPKWAAALPAREPGKFWMGSLRGLQCWDHGVSKPPTDARLSQGPVGFIHEDQATNLWVNVEPGRLFRQDQDHWVEVDLGDRTAPVNTVCMEEGRNGNLWLGTDQGLVQLRKRQVRSYTTRDGLASEQVWSVCEATDGTIWVGTHVGISHIQDGAVAPRNASDLSWAEVRSVWPGRAGGVRIATRLNGIYELTDRLQFQVPTNALPNRKIAALYEDRAARLWVGTQNGVAAVVDGRVVLAYTNWAGQSGYDVRCILEDRAGAFWFATQGQGLTRLHQGKFEVFTMRDGLSDNNVWAIHEDAAGTLWFGTENGLTRYQQGRFYSFARNQGLLENTVNWILEDDHGYFWLSGLRGIYRIKREQLNAVADGRLPSVQVATFGTADGMESNETNGENQPAGWKARDGRLWFPTTRGVVVLDPNAIEINDTPPQVVIEQVKVDEEIIFGDGLTRSNQESKNADFNLAPGRAQLVGISYTANQFVDSRRTRFRYRLVGRDADWREDTTDRIAHYTNLRPGDYRFEVIAANPHGVWNTKPASFAFSLAPYFHERWLFKIFCGVAVLGVAAGVQAYRLRWQHRMLKLEQQTAIANERTRIARDLHDDLGTALTGLALELEVVGREATASPPVAGHLVAAAQRTRDLAGRMREVVWSVNPECDTLSSFANFLEQQISQFLHAADVRVRLDFPDDIPAIPLSAEARHQLALSTREALTNIVRHAHASEVVVSLAIASQTLTVQIKDNGRGIQSPDREGQGLKNMRARLEQIEGSFECVSSRDTGTTLTFHLPVPPPVAEKNNP